jgi:hypothetical protein
MAGDGAKCSDEVNDGTYFMAGVMAVTGLMATVLALSGIFHCALRRVGQPSIISHILVYIYMHADWIGLIIKFPAEREREIEMEAIYIYI